jgi:hypothetical protein
MQRSENSFDQKLMVRKKTIFQKNPIELLLKPDEKNYLNLEFFSNVEAIFGMKLLKYFCFKN